MGATTIFSALCVLTIGLVAADLSTDIGKCIQDAANNIGGCSGCGSMVAKAVEACHSNPPDMEKCFANILDSIFNCAGCMDKMFCIYEQCCHDICDDQGCTCLKLPNVLEKILHCGQGNVHANRIF